MRKLIVYILALVSATTLHAAIWKTHFAYTNVEQIAVTPNEVFGLSDGSLYSVNKQTEKLSLWGLSSGLHSTGICCIGFDSRTETLIIMYNNGKMDLMRGQNITYVGDLYLEDMTASKRANSITFHNGLVYLGMPFGIMTFNLDKREFPDTWYIGAEASEQNIQSIFFESNTIYAATDSLLFSAELDSNLVDFRVWDEQPLPTSGHLYNLLTAAKAQAKSVTEGAYTWQAAGAQGISKTGLGHTQMYKPDGPLDNNPYRMYYQGGKLYVLPGARWAVQSWNPGQVSFFDQGRWFHITNDYIQSRIGARAFDFMNIAVKPDDPNMFYVTSYGTGLYLFRNTVIQDHWMPENSGLQPAAPTVPEWYTRTDGAVFDSLGNLWMMNCSGAVDELLCIRRPDGSWFNLNATIDGARVFFDTPGEIIISHKADRYKWLPSCRNETAIVLLDDGGTPFNTQDDHSYIHKTWVDQNGLQVEPEFIYCANQDRNGGLWVGTDNGPFYIASVDEFMRGNACQRVRFLQDDGQYLMDDERINCIVVDEQDRTWIGTQTQGIYVISPDRSHVEMHLLPDENNPMPSACILSIAINERTHTYYIGTGEGIVSYQDKKSDLNNSPYVSYDTYDDEEHSGMMGSWTLHFAYRDVTSIAVSPEKAYGLSEGALFSVSRADEEVRYCNRLSGLSDANIASIAYDNVTQQLLILYSNGNFDLLNDEGDIWNIADLRNKQLSGMSKQANAVTMYGGYAYLAMPFGIMQINLRKHEIADTWYIGQDAANVEVTAIGFSGDSIYALSANKIYAAAQDDNLVDYHAWNARPLNLAEQSAFAHLPVLPYVGDTIVSRGDTFIAAASEGILRIAQDGTRHSYVPNGPATNMPYSLSVLGNRLIAVPGGRWAIEFQRHGNVMIYDNGQWFNSTYEDLKSVMDWMPVLDFVGTAIDPLDPQHFIVASYGTGIYEYRNDKMVQHHSFYNSDLRPAAADASPYYYTRVDGPAFDNDGNVWMMNAGSNANNICILAPDGSWRSCNLYHYGKRLVFETPGQILIDRLHPTRHWLPSLRASAVAGAKVGLGLLDDNGTPLVLSDDRMAFYSSFVDQFGSIVEPDNIFCLSQDNEGTIWVGTNEGVFSIAPNADFLVSNACLRYKINRNDGSGLADFLLSSESIRAIAHDGGNRHWFGTAGNGVFLIQYRDVDDVATIYHFTTANSPLPSDNILSIAILPETGEVFFGTESGLASFRADAGPAADNFSTAYVFPNPVRPNFEGNITFAGLMENTYVKVVDAAGNLVFSTRSNGSIAVWNGRDASGRKVVPGVYRAFCNTPDGEHTVLSVLIMQ